MPTWQEVLTLAPQPRVKALDASVMDIADDITYAIHDVHDYFRLGVIPLHEIGLSLTGRLATEEGQDFKRYAETALTLKPEVGYSATLLRRAEEWLARLSFPLQIFRDSEQDRQALHDFESTAVKAVVEAVDIEDGTPSLPSHVALALEFLKELTWFYVINNPQLSASQEGQRRIIRDLHQWLCDWAAECHSDDVDFGTAKTDRNLRRLPARFNALVAQSSPSGGDQNQRISRAAVDYIVGLTDAEAVSLHHHLGGSGGVVSSVDWL